MALDPCAAGCLNHNIPSPDVPVAGDDPCNGAGNGYFCQGSYWLYDPAEPGSNPAVDGDCPRLFLRNGGDCGVYQWLEIALASLVSDTVAPVNGVDCCPPGTLWCVPATGGVTVDQLWISANGCGAGPCTWCKLCGALQARWNLSLPGPSVNVPEGIQTLLVGDTVVYDNFGGMNIGASTFTFPHDGCFYIAAWALGDYVDVNFGSAIFRLGYTINAGAVTWVAQITPATLNRTFPDLYNVVLQASTYECFSAGDILRPVLEYDTTEGGTTIPITIFDYRIFEYKL
jgi:hypothetical protein